MSLRFAKFTGKQASGPANLLKRDSSIGVFLWILRFSLEHHVYRILPVAASENNEQQQSEGFANSCYKIVPPVLLQGLILSCRNFARWFVR